MARSSKARKTHSEEDTAPVNPEGVDEPSVDPAPKLAPALDEIYAEEGGGGDMTKLDRRPSHRTRKIVLTVIAVLLVLFAATVVGFVVFTKGKGKFGERIELTVTGPTTAASGEDVTYRIAFANRERIRLDAAALTLQYPEGLRFANATPKPSNEFNNAWSLGSLQPKAGGEISVSGQLIGALDEALTIRATLTYRPENFNYDFQKEATMTTTVGVANVKLTTTVPLRVVAGKEFRWEIGYENTLATTIERVRIVAEYPDDFTVAGVEPAAKERDRLWEFDRLEPGAKGAIAVRGTLKGEPGEAREFQVKVGVVEDDGSFRLTGETSKLLFLVRSGVTVSLTVNGDIGEPVAAWKDRLVFHLVYKNDGDSEVDDASIALTLQGKDRLGDRDDLLDWSTLVDERNGQRSGNVLTWDKRNIAGLERVKPGEGGEITLSVKLRDTPAVKKETDVNFSVVATARSTVGKTADIDAENATADSNAVTVKLSSKVALTAEGRYYSELYEPLGTGPLPPAVGKTTTYRIVWNLTNTTNDLTGATVKTSLPETVLWTGRSSVTAGEALRFDPKTREVVWSISKVPAGSGQLLPTLEASFEVSVTPQAADAGTVLVLVRKSTLAATDASTKSTLTAEDGLVTSELENDVNAKGKGIVVQ